MIIEYSGWFARLALAAVFGWAAWGKFRSPGTTRAAVAGFGVPTRFVPTVAIGLSLVEAVIAVGVLVGPVGRWAAVAAAGLLVSLTVVVVRSLVLGRRPTCACFGADAGPVGVWTVVRNGLLLAVAGLAAVGSPDGLPVDHVVGSAIAAALISVQVRQHLALRNRPGVPTHPAGLEVGSRVPALELTTLDDTPRTLPGLLTGPVALVFVHPGCGPCGRVVAEVPRWRRDRAGTLDILVIGGGPSEATGLWFEMHSVPDGLIHQGHGLARDYRLAAFPSALLVDRNGRVTSGTVAGPDAIRELITNGPVGATTG